MRLRIPMGIAVLTMCLSAPAHTQERPSKPAAHSYKDEIIVHGQSLYTDQVNALKTPTPIIDVPQSVSIVDVEQIQAQGFESLGDVVNYVPGVTNTMGEGHRDAIVFRGVRSTADFYVDGIRDDVQYYRGLYNIEQVEVLRGANALLFGRGGTGGLINRVTKKPEFGDDFTILGTSLDTFGAANGNIDVNRGLTNKVAMRVNAAIEHLNNHRDFYSGDRFAINPTLRAQMGTSGILDISYEYNDNQRFIDRGIPTGDNGRPVSALKDITFGDKGLNTTEFRAHILRATMRNRFSDHFKGVLSASYGDYDKLYQNFYVADYDAAANTVTLDGYVDSTRRKSFNLSAHLVGAFSMAGISHTVITGAEYWDTQNNNDRFNTFFDQSQDDQEIFSINRPILLANGLGVNAAGLVTRNNFSTDLNDDTRAKVNVLSAFVQDEILILPWLDFVLGGRYDRFDFSVNDIKNRQNRGRIDEEISPRFGVIFKPKENISVYGIYSQSFLPRSGGQYAGVSDQTQLFEPDIFKTREVGLKWNIRPSLAFTGAYFENKQTIDAAVDGAPENLERRGLEVNGFEFQLSGDVSERLNVHLGYTNLSGKTDFTLDGQAQEYPRELPKHKFSIWSNYRLSTDLRIGLGAIYQSRAFITDLDIGTNEAGHPTLPGFTRFDGAMHYALSELLSLSLNIENLTNIVYFPTSHSLHQVSVGAPRNARLTVSAKF